MIKRNTYDYLKRFFDESGVVRGYFPSNRDVFDVLGKDHVKILYGETYDLYGITIDSLKYYLFVSLLHELYFDNSGLQPEMLSIYPTNQVFLPRLHSGSNLSKFGINNSVESTILIADTASTINTSSGDAQTILTEGKRRLDQVNEIIRTYQLPVRVQLMSELFQTSSVQTLITDVQTIVAKSHEIQSLLRKTVLQNRIRQENKTMYTYAAQAIATALLYDLKVGPPRERFYDEAAILVSKELKRKSYASIYLTPTYPLGLDFVYFLLHPEIEEYGLTPYKAGSNKLEAHRIILGKTTPKRVQQLISTSFVPKKYGLPDPVGDLNSILSLAQHFRKEATYENIL